MEPATSSFAERAKQKVRSLPASGRTIGTHSGSFQADEALACWLLRQLPTYAGASITRSRDAPVLAPLDIVVDVGGAYDPERKRFDHHQRGFFETADGAPGAAANPSEATGRWRTKLSSAGLVYKHFGREIIAHFAETTPADTEAVWAELYDTFMEGIDAVDNGVEICEGAARYKEGTSLSVRVGRLNSRWNEVSDEEDQMRRFEAASALCGEEFLAALGEIVEAWLPARAKVHAALEERLAIHPCGQVLKFENGGMPWREHLYSLEREAGIEGLIKFVVYVDSAGMWRVQAVTVEGTQFANRLSLPEPWRGLRDAALEEVAGIPGCCFVHAAGFIGGHKTYEGALAMAQKALEVGKVITS